MELKWATIEKINSDLPPPARTTVASQMQVRTIKRVSGETWTALASPAKLPIKRAWALQHITEKQKADLAMVRRIRADPSIHITWTYEFLASLPGRTEAEELELRAQMKANPWPRRSPQSPAE